MIKPISIQTIKLLNLIDELDSLNKKKINQNYYIMNKLKENNMKIH